MLVVISTHVKRLLSAVSASLYLQPSETSRWRRAWHLSGDIFLNILTTVCQNGNVVMILFSRNGLTLPNTCRYFIFFIIIAIVKHQMYTISIEVYVLQS